MKMNSFTYLIMLNGKHGEFNDLPLKIMDLKIDFYRGLSWLVRKSGAYEKTSTPFMEFYWADYLKKELKLSSTDEVLKTDTLLKAITSSIVENKFNTILPGFIRRKYENLVFFYFL